MTWMTLTMSQRDLSWMPTSQASKKLPLMLATAVLATQMCVIFTVAELAVLGKVVIIKDKEAAAADNVKGMTVQCRPSH